MSFQVAVAQPEVQPEAVFAIGNFVVSNAMMMSVVVTFIFLFLSVGFIRKSKLVPSIFQTMFELLVDGILGLLESIMGNRKGAEKMLPLIGSLFLFVGLSNVIALFPGVTSFTYDGVQMFRTPTNDFNTTFSIALAMIILTQIASMKEFGIFGHLGKYFKFKDVVVGFKKGAGEGVLAIVDFLIGLLDIVSEIAKVISLSLRLFGNMYAGEVLAAILLGTFAMFIPAPWLAMNLLVGLLQALVFGSLTAAYYALAIEKSEEQIN
ncbi:MAG: F0F1 ATP synthase subunit A [Candidatus Magasanikbacteria bacterium]|jgi:F-type H+-transporting ATPase subunit a|nr:F0F1 ATP synthase subunit A [Candidatus Magasanikbacteria bacterium]MBT4071654.1 F0F1 ATP synthase subunit A [Candidatus Magasanikbacteria bacterium]